MAKVDIKMPDEFLEKLAHLANDEDGMAERVLTAGAEIVEACMTWVKGGTTGDFVIPMFNATKDTVSEWMANELLYHGTEPVTLTLSPVNRIRSSRSSRRMPPGVWPGSS